MRARSFLLVAAGLLIAAWPASGQPGTRLVINHFIADPDQKSLVFVTDFSGESPQVTVTFYDEAGNIVGQKKVQVPRNGTHVIKPFEVIQRRAYGNVGIESQGGTVAAEYWQIIETKETEYSVAVPAQPAGGHRYLIGQHFVADPDVNSLLFVTNPDPGASVQVTLEFHDEAGNVLSQTQRSIGPRGTLSLKPYEVLQKRGYGNVHVRATGAGVVGEYWQLVDGRFKDERTGKEKEVRYGVAVPLQSLSPFGG